MGWVVCSDTVLESRDAVLIFVVTASRCIYDVVSSHYREILDQCWCRGSGPELQLMTPRTMSSGLAQNPSPSTPYVPPTKKDWDILFQPMFDEYFQPPSVVSRAPAFVAPIHDDTTGTPSSTLIDQDAPSASTSPTTEDTQAPVLH
ncbi:hypothetical protein Tco_0040886 [Tanacetum coccineum]